MIDLIYIVGYLIYLIGRSVWLAFCYIVVALMVATVFVIDFVAWLFGPSQEERLQTARLVALDEANSAHRHAKHEMNIAAGQSWRNFVN